MLGRSIGSHLLMRSATRVCSEYLIVHPYERVVFPGVPLIRMPSTYRQLPTDLSVHQLVVKVVTEFVMGIRSISRSVLADPILRGKLANG